MQYGLIAEEVARIFPELVIRNGSGVIQGLRYDELAPMLLNEVKQQQNRLEALGREVRDLVRHQRQMQASLDKVRIKAELVAQR